MAFVRQWLLVIVAIALFPSLARADAASDRMHKHYQLGMAAVARGDHRAAIAEFDEAYAAVAKPNILYNIAKEYETLGKDGDLPSKKLAVKYFRRYLDERKDAPDRDQVELFISHLDKEILDAEAPREAPPPPQPPPPQAPTVTAPAPAAATPAPVAATPAPAHHHNGLAITVTVAGALIAVGGAGMLGGAFAVNDGGNGASTLADRNNAHDTATALLTGGGVLLGVGAAIAIGGIVMLVIPSKEAPKATAWWIAPSTNGVAAGGTF